MRKIIIAFGLSALLFGCNLANSPEPDAEDPGENQTEQNEVEENQTEENKVDNEVEPEIKEEPVENQMEQDKTDNEEIDESESGNEIGQEQLKDEIYGLILKANHCEADEDCVVLEIENLACPFGCTRLGNKDTDLTLIEQKIEEYFENYYEKCVYDCDTQPSQYEIKCVDNKCIDARYENS